MFEMWPYLPKRLLDLGDVIPARRHMLHQIRCYAFAKYTLHMLLAVGCSGLHSARGTDHCDYVQKTRSDASDADIYT